MNFEYFLNLIGIRVSFKNKLDKILLFMAFFYKFFLSWRGKMYKIVILAILLLFLNSCLPHITYNPEKNHSNKNEENEIKPLLFTQAELDLILSSEEPPIKVVDSNSNQTPLINGSQIVRLELPISEESNDDFNLEILPGDYSKQEPSFDIPIVVNEKVEHFIQYFQTTARNRFSNWLARSEKYIPFMKNLLRENGLPEDLVYLALIESGFNPYAYSRSKASGPWQFIYLTGKKYGLKVNWWVDERRDPEKSTIAAAKYLKDLYDMFECWYLAAAGYNAGENKIINAMKRYRTEDFWELSKYHYLKKETKDYVPQMIAAALIAKDPEKYGFTDIEYEEPLQYEKVKVPPATDLRIIAKALEISLEELKDLNPELLRWCTPPYEQEYEIKIPYGKKEIFFKNFEEFLSNGKFQFATHVVRKGDTFSKIANKYGVAIEPILEINKMKKSTPLSVGMNLIIPIPKDSNGKRPLSIIKGSKEVGEEIIYIIKPGDTLWSISSEMGINIGALSKWNNIHPERKLMPGDKLRIKVGNPNLYSQGLTSEKKIKEVSYLVRPGDSLWSIAKKYNSTVSDIKTWNNLGKSDIIYPGTVIKLRIEEPQSSTMN